MNLKLTKYTNTPGTFEAEWFTREITPTVGTEGEEGYQPETTKDTTLRVIAYSGDQIDLFRADVAKYGGEVDELFLAEIAAEWVPPPAPPPAPPKQFTSLEFLDLFTDAEQLAIVQATLQNAQVKLWYDKLLAANFITLADPRTEAGLTALVQAGLLTAERNAEIVEAMQ